MTNCRRLGTRAETTVAFRSAKVAFLPTTLGDDAPVTLRDRPALRCWN